MTKKTLFKCLLLTVLLVQNYATKNHIFVGEAGVGKSTLINSLFGVNAPTGNVVSITANTTKYEATSSAKPFFRGCNAFDTRGICDTNGTSDREIMTEVEGIYLRYADSSQTNVVDSFIIVINGDNNRVRLNILFGELLNNFSPSVLKSMVIVINIINNPDLEELRSYVQEQSQIAIDKKYTSKIIPIVLMNAKNPSEQQLKLLASALNKIEPYELKDLEIKRQKIMEIYQEMIKKPENFKTEIEKMIKDKPEILKKQVYAKVPLEVTETRTEGCRFSVNLPFLQYCQPNRISEKKIIVVDELKEITEETTRQSVEEVERQVLKNELQVYWLLAVEEYERRIHDDIHGKKPKPKYTFNKDL